MDPMLNAVWTLLARLASRSASPQARSNTGVPSFAMTTIPENESAFARLSTVLVVRRMSSSCEMADCCPATGVAAAGTSRKHRAGTRIVRLMQDWSAGRSKGFTALRQLRNGHRQPHSKERDLLRLQRDARVDALAMLGVGRQSL